MKVDAYIPYSNGGFYCQKVDEEPLTYSKDISSIGGLNLLSFSSNGLLGNLEIINDASDIIKLYGINKPDIYNRDMSFVRKFNKINNKIVSYKKTFTDLGINFNEVKIEYCIPDKLLSEFLSFRVEFLKLFSEYIKNTDLSYYNEYFKKSKYALSNLQDIAFDKEYLSYSLLLNKSVISSTSNFRLKTGTNISSPIKMNMFGTRTGRLTVKSGLDILTLPKTYRSIIQSKFTGGEVHLFDFNAFEIRVAAFLIERFDIVEQDDIHCFFAEKVFGSKDKRGLFKKAFFPIFYGSSIERLSGLCDISFSDAKDLSKKIKKVFPYHKINDLISKYRIGNKSYIKNCFGRPIFIEDDCPSYKLVNYFIQSSASDLALQTLYDIVKYIQEERLKSGPIYIHHDAIAIDISPKEKKYLSTIKDIMENKNRFGVKFPISNDILIRQVV